MYIVRMRHTGFIYLTTSLIQHKFKTKKYMCNHFKKTTTHVKKNITEQVEVPVLTLIIYQLISKWFEFPQLSIHNSIS